MSEPIPNHPNPSRPDWEVLLSPSQPPLGGWATAHTPAPGQPHPVPPGGGDGHKQKGTQVKRDKVLAWLRDHASQSVMYSDVSRALITNSHRQRARSREARGELRSTLASLQDEGVVSLSTEVDGRSGLVIAVRKSKKQFTHGARDE